MTEDATPTIRPLSYSRIDCYTYLCPFVYFLRYIEKVRVDGTDLNRVWGTALHKAIQLWHNANRQGDLLTLIDKQFATELAPYGLEDNALRIMELSRLAARLLRDLQKSYKQPTACAAYTTNVDVMEMKALEAEMKTLAANTELRYTPNRGVMHRALEHEFITDAYRAFDAAWPLATYQDMPAVEVDETFVLKDARARIIVDQYRIIPEGDHQLKEHAGGVIPVDLKTSFDELPQRLVDVNRQLHHYQLGSILHPSLPDARGAGIYNLRTGRLTVQNPITQQQADEWTDNIAQVMAAEQHNIFPKRRDAKCLQCDYIDHCLPKEG